MSESLFVKCTYESLFLEAGQTSRGGERQWMAAPEDAGAVSSADTGRLELQTPLGPASIDYTVTSHSPHTPAVRGHICEDSEQKLASVAWLKGGRDDDIAALGLLCPQENATRVDVDGAGGLMLQAVHAVLAVLLHLCGDRKRWVTHSPAPESIPPPAGYHEQISRIHGQKIASKSIRTKLAWLGIG